MVFDVEQRRRLDSKCMMVQQMVMATAVWCYGGGAGWCGSGGDGGVDLRKMAVVRRSAVLCGNQPAAGVDT